MMNADKALQTLIDGNQRYIAGTSDDAELTITTRRQSINAGQSPFAVILGCSDSRVPVELVFNQGLGDLFVIRVAGNIAAPSQIGSVEYACQHLGTRLVVVLGHSHCGAINATVDSLLGELNELSPNIASIVDHVSPAVHPVVMHKQYTDKDELVHQAMRANVEQSVSGLQMRSPILRDMVNRNKIKIIGAEYSIETGVVDFYRYS